MIVVLGYFVGGISTGYYLVRLLRHQDIRNYGSGATGATNVGRMLGAKGFVLTFLGDAFKGCLIPALAIFLERSDIIVLLALIAVVVGHIWPIHLGFRGGKGVATAFGGIAVLDPPLALVLFVCAMGLFVITKKFSLSGLLVILGSPIVAFIMSRSAYRVTGILVISIILIIAHRENISRILAEALASRRD